MTTAVQLAQSVAPGVSLGFKNRIINGGMTIDQRNAGASVTPTTTAYVLDRWYAFMDQASKYSVQQSTTAPVGFTNSMLITSTSAYTVGAGEAFGIRQQIEGFNVADLGWGTINAQPVTLSFKVRSSLTGTFGGVLRNSANNRTYPSTYTISAPNTFEDKSVTIAGDTTGTWLTTNGAGIGVQFGIGVSSTISGPAGAWSSTGYWSATGATSVVGTSGATFYITGVQLEVGTAATNFEFRDYGRELMLCQRYYWQVPASANYGGIIPSLACGQGWTSANTANHSCTFPVPMRAAPALYQSGLRIYSAGGAASSATIALASGTNYLAATLNSSGASGLTVGYMYWIAGNSVATDYIGFGAEL